MKKIIIMITIVMTLTSSMQILDDKEDDGVYCINISVESDNEFS